MRKLTDLRHSTHILKVARYLSLVMLFGYCFSAPTAVAQDIRPVRKLVNGVLVERYSYDSTGEINMIEQFSESGGNNGTIEFSQIDDRRQRIIRWIAPSGQFFKQVVITTDDEGLPMRQELKVADGQGQMIPSQTRTFDNDPSQSMPVKRILYHDEKGRVDSFCIYHYTDQFGSAVILNFSKNGTMLSTETVKCGPFPDPDYQIFKWPGQSPFLDMRRVRVGANGSISPRSFKTEVRIGPGERPLEANKIYEDGSQLSTVWEYEPVGK